jgi:hypothetical protein
MIQDAMTLKGIVRGKTIELEQDPGLPDGESVTVTLRHAEPKPPEPLPEEDVEPVATSSPPRPSGFLTEESRRRWEEAWAQVKDLPPGEGLRRAFGAWAEDAEEVDKFLEWNRAQRKLERRSPDL